MTVRVNAAAHLMKQLRRTVTSGAQLSWWLKCAPGFSTRCRSEACEIEWLMPLIRCLFGCSLLMVIIRLRVRFSWLNFKKTIILTLVQNLSSSKKKSKSPLNYFETMDYLFHCWSGRACTYGMIKIQLSSFRLDSTHSKLSWIFYRHQKVKIWLHTCGKMTLKV